MSGEFNGSLVMEEFMKIAKENGLITTNIKKDKDFVGNPSTPTPVKDHRRYEPTEEYDVTKHKDVVQLAHPKKVQVADSMGEGSVVENLNEQQEKDIEVATKMPNGALVGVHADVIHNLVKLANKLEDEGKYLEARYVDDTIERLARLPFKQSHLYKEAWLWPAVQIGLTLAGMFGTSVIDWWRTEKNPITKRRELKYTGKKLVGKTGTIAGLITTGIGILTLLGNKITGIQESVKDDTQDLIDVLKKSESQSAKKALGILNQFSDDLMNPSLSEKYYNSLIKANRQLPQIESYITFYTKIEDPSKTGFGLSGRVENKFNDFKDSLNEAIKNFSDAKNVASKASQYAEKDLEVKNEISDNNVKFIQNVLFNRGFKGKVWSGEINGIEDENTIEAAKELEIELDKTLQPFAKKKGLRGTMIGEVVKNNKISIKDPEKLKTVLEMAEKL